jgi:hypothetical protein
MTREQCLRENIVEVRDFLGATDDIHPMDWWPAKSPEWTSPRDTGDAAEAFGAYCYVEGYAAALDMTAVQLICGLEV